MGYDNELLAFLRDGRAEGMAITILGSLKSLNRLQRHSHNTVPIQFLTNQETSMNHHQTERDSMMIDRVVATRDRDRERVKRRCSTSVEVRYLRSLRNLRDRLRAAYSCNQHHCPMIRDRLEQHHIEQHHLDAHSSPGRAQACVMKTRSMATSPSPKQFLSTGCGPDPDMNSNHASQPECLVCEAPQSSSPCNMNTENADLKIVKKEDDTDNIDISATNNDNNITNNIKNSYDTEANKYALVPTKMNKCCMIDNANNTQSHKYVDRDPSDTNYTSRPYRNEKFSETQPNKSRRGSKNKRCRDCSDQNEKQKVNKANTCNMNKFNNKQQRNSFGNQTPHRKRSYGIDKSCSSKSDNSIPQKQNRRYNNRDYYNNGNKQTTKRSSADSHTSCNRKKPYAIDKSCASKSDSLLGRDGSGGSRYSGPIDKAVREWIREIPMYPGLGKEAKEDNKNAINNLVRNLNMIPAKAGSEYEEKLRSEIENFLNKIPIWYPGARREQGVFKTSLIDRLIQMITNGNQRASKTSEASNSKGKVNKQTVTEMYISNESNIDETKKAILDWLRSISIKTNDNSEMGNKMPQIADFVILRINPLLNKPIGTNNHKLILKTAIINIMNDLPININCPKNRNVHIHRFADDLANRLLSVRAKCTNSNIYNNVSTVTSASPCCNTSCGTRISNEKQRQTLICSEVRKCFENANIDCHNMVVEDAGIILVDFCEMRDLEGENNAKNDIINLLVTSTNLSEAEASSIAEIVIAKVRNITHEDSVCIMPLSCQNSRLPNTLSVYTSIEECSPLNYPITSTPKKKPVNKAIPRFNPQEVQYMEKLANLIRTWMNTLPYNFSAPEEQSFKKTIIDDLAGDIMDEVKLEQLAPIGTKRDRGKVLKHIVSKWIWRLEIFDLKEVEPQINYFLNQIESTPALILTQPQHGNRQVMRNNMRDTYEEGEGPYLARGTDILEDAISIWLNEQPSNIFTSNCQSLKNKKVHELANVLEYKLTNKRPQKEISRDVAEWLNNIVKSEEKRAIPGLTENLTERVFGLPQDATLAANFNIKIREAAERMEERMKTKTNPPANRNIDDENKNETFDQEKTMKIFLSKYIEHNYDIDDPLARRAFNRLLKTHLQRLNPPTRKEVYDNFGKSESDDRFPSKNLIRELEYIKDISDWLKNLPVDASYNTLGNRERIDFVNSLAMSLSDIEEERDNNPNAMDYDLYMGSTILEFLHLLPLPQEYVNAKFFLFIVGQLYGKIVAHRQNVRKRTKANESLNETGVNNENMGDFIEEFIRINGNDIAQDEVKLEAWAIRLIREIKKLVRDTARPSVLSKSHIYNKLTDVPIPGDETAKLFSLELEYVKEITNWLKNLPLLPIRNSEDEEDRIRKICKLAENMTEMEKNRALHPSNTTIDADFKEYVAKWISELPLDKRQNIVLPIVVPQLIKRMKKVQKKEVLPDITFPQSNETIEKTPCYVKKLKNSSSKSRKKNEESNNSNNLIIDVIENWSNALPIKAENEMATTNMKNDVSRKLFQKVGQLNVDPKVFNDDLLYQDMLVDEIDTIFENLPQNDDLQNNREKLKSDIVSAIAEARNDIKEKTAGDVYKLKLENTIDASIPNPVNVNQVYDPGFEIYKERLATMFILDNFDHGTDAVKTKYQKQVKKEIDKYFNHAKNKNAVAISKDEIYNELYSALFKVPIPNETSVIKEVEEVKTRCEIDVWFGELPMREANGINELFEWDQILSTLAKRIHEIETSESKPDEKIFKEIMKWLVKLPLRPGYEHRLEEFATKLQKTLKSTAGQRKCILDDFKTIKGKKGRAKTKAKESAKKQKDTSEITRPSNSGSMRISIPQPQQTPVPRGPRKTAADKIFEIVQTWCNHLNICVNSPSEQENAQMLKENLITKIIIKISELNMNTEIFNNVIYYDELLDEEIERLLSTLPKSCNFDTNKATRKYELKEAINSIRPLIIEEKAYHKYKQDLNANIDEILEKPLNLSPEKEALYVELKNDIIDDFLQYNYNKDDDEGIQNNKRNVLNTIAKYNSTIAYNREGKRNALMKSNELMCELAKVSTTYEINLRDEVEEIRMKKEIEEFFDSIGVAGTDFDKAKVNPLKESLAKKLNEIEMNGHSTESDTKMKQEIARCLGKLRKEVNPTVIDSFIDKLKNSELARRTPPLTRKSCLKNCKRVICNVGNQNSRTDIGNSANSSKLLESSIQLANIESADFHISAPFNLCPNNLQNDTNLVAQRIECGPREQVSYENRETEVLEDSKSDSEDEEEKNRKKCLCRRKLRSYGRRPYCMVPMRFMYEGCDGYNPFWCRMPLPGFL